MGLLEGTLLEDTLLEGTKNRPEPTKSGGPKSAVFHGGSRVAEMPGRAGSGRVGSGRAGTIRIFEHTLNNARFAPKYRQNSCSRGFRPLRGRNHVESYSVGIFEVSVGVWKAGQ